MGDTPDLIRGRGGRGEPRKPTRSSRAKSRDAVEEPDLIGAK
jgi:hypothetical protein